VLIDSAADNAIVERVVKGDVEAFGILVERYQDRIYSAVHNYVTNAVDIAQDAFVKAYAKLRSFDASSAFYTWLYRIAVNTAIDFLRRRKSRPADSLDDDKFTTVGFEPASQNPRSNPERVAILDEQRRALRTSIGRLSNKLRAVLVLHDVEGLSQEEVAEILRVPVGTVKSRVSRARAELRTLLGKQLGDAL
jgi:RNA polymerase sigma-70 factor (ECF subfamily)